MKNHGGFCCIHKIQNFIPETQLLCPAYLKVLGTCLRSSRSPVLNQLSFSKTSILRATFLSTSPLRHRYHFTTHNITRKIIGHRYIFSSTLSNLGRCHVAHRMHTCHDVCTYATFTYVCTTFEVVSICQQSSKANHLTDSCRYRAFQSISLFFRYVVRSDTVFGIVLCKVV